MAAILEFLVYPFALAFGFPESENHPVNISLLITNLIFFLDIALSFLLAVRKEGDQEEYVTNFEKISVLYLKSNFVEDLLIALPLGYIGKCLHQSLEILYAIKVSRLNQIRKFLQPSFYNRHIRKIFSDQLQKVLMNDKLRDNIHQSNNFIIPRLRA